MSAMVHIGLAVTSHDPSSTAEAQISHVISTGTVEPANDFRSLERIGFPSVDDLGAVMK